MMMLQHGSSSISNDFPSKQWHLKLTVKLPPARGLRILMEGHVSGMGPAASASNLVAVRVPWRKQNLRAMGGRDAQAVIHGP